jgi:type II secretory pathway pseudopilin PulG
MKRSEGFTLIEVIVIMTTIAIAAALFASYTGGTSFTQSPASAGLVNKQYMLIQQMEIITSKYRQALPIADICAFKVANVDGKAFVDPANTWCNQGLTSGPYTTQNVLLVTLTDGQQTLQSIFTQ